jgi:hypothetical protein
MAQAGSSGVTASERYLDGLCKRSFLSLWSYPNLYRDQGRKHGKGDGKELCDHLIIFNEHVIIFSDKSCAFPNTGNEALDWTRWYRRSIAESAEQIYGTERWLLKYPDRVFTDKACTNKLPIPIDKSSRIHRIVVALNASSRCEVFFGNTGSGSLALSSEVNGPNLPFWVGEVDQSRGFVHILDDVTLDIVLGELDTITDFTNYLSKKEALFRSRKIVVAPGEEDLLAHYITHTNKEEKHDFVVAKRFDGISFPEGAWASVASNPKYAAKKAADRSSYAWDELIEKFNQNAIAGTLAQGNEFPLSYHERGLRMLASESRLSRRGLVAALFDLLATTPDGHNKMRMVISKQSRQRAYILLIGGENITHPEYRERRTAVLAAYCEIAKIYRPKLLDVIGIATEPIDCDARSEDLAYLDLRNWDRERQRSAEELQRKTRLLTNLTMHNFHDEEYPGQDDQAEAVRVSKPSNKSKKRAELKARRNRWK